MGRVGKWKHETVDKYREIGETLIKLQLQFIRQDNPDLNVDAALTNALMKEFLETRVNKVDLQKIVEAVYGANSSPAEEKVADILEAAVGFFRLQDGKLQRYFLPLLDSYAGFVLAKQGFLKTK